MPDWRADVLKFWFGLDPKKWWKADPDLDHLRPDWNGLLPGRRIDPLNLTPLMPVAHQLIQTVDLIKYFLESGRCRRFIGGPCGTRSTLSEPEQAMVVGSERTGHERNSGGGTAPV